MWQRWSPVILPSRLVCSTCLPQHPGQVVCNFGTSTHSASALPLTGTLPVAVRTVRGGRGGCVFIPSNFDGVRTMSATSPLAAVVADNSIAENVDLSIPTDVWSSEAIQAYEDLATELTGPDAVGDWEKKPFLVDVNTPVDERRLMTRCDREQTGNFFNYAFFVDKESRVLRGVIEFGPYLQGPPLCAHGGASATLADACMGSLNFHCGIGAVTANLNIDYKNFVLLGKPYLFESAIERVEGRKVFTSFKITAADDRSKVCVKSTALFLTPKEAQQDEDKDAARLAPSKKSDGAKL